MAEERLKLAVFIDFDNIQIGVKDTLGKEFDVSVVLEALKERGEVITKVAYGDWPRAGEHSKQMTQHAVQMVQRNVTPRGDKNGADINLALDALEMAFTRHHINAFAVVGGDSDFIALVEKLKQYDKQVFVVGGRGFTSNILQRNCTEFIAYENLIRPGGYVAAVRPRSSRRGEPARAAIETRALSDALPNIQRALAVLAERGVSPQLGLLKSTLLQLDSTFTERDYGVSTFLDFMQKMEEAGLLRLRKIDRGYLVETAGKPAEAPAVSAPENGHAAAEEISAETEVAVNGDGAAGPAGQESAPEGPPVSMTPEQALEILRRAVEAESEKSPNRPLYLRHIRHGLKGVDKDFDERRAGFARITDLLHGAQREGWLSLQRDRKGVLRMFYRPQSEAAEAVEEAAAIEETGPVQAEATASTDFWESGQTIAVPDVPPAEAAAAENTGAPLVVAEAAAVSAPVDGGGAAAEPGPAAPAEAALPRKPRGRRAAPRGPRKAARRKAKDRSE
ncbi:MAG TPA: NYN domain-containing protein [Terriglobia bacterium]|nr:NYN domain-containing protein [Terriglobia bacterium]